MKKLFLLLSLLFLAQFIQAATLNITKTGTGTGQVRVNNILFDLPYSGTFTNNTDVTVEAVPTSGTSNFTGWGGDLSGTTNPTTIKVNGTRNVTAEFTLIPRTLSITKTGTGSGQVKVGATVYSLPYSGTFPHGTVVTLEAVPDAATSSFTGWGGDLTGTTSPTTITMNGSKNVTAEFTPLRTLSITMTGTGTGKVKVNSTLYDLPYSGKFATNTSVSLEAVPDAASSSFINWGGDLTGTANPTSITMNDDKSVSARFNLLDRTLTINTSTGTGTGQVKVNGTVVTSFPFIQTYPNGTSVNIEAVADGATSSFSSWSGDLAGQPASTSVTMDGNKTTSAAFTLLQRTLSITKTGTGSGQVRVNGTLWDLPYSGSFPHNTVVTVEAVADGTTSSFTGWGGDLSGTTSPTTITMNGSKSVSAAFTLLPRNLMVLQNTGTGTGQVKVNDTLRTLPYSASYPHGTIVKLEAVADGATSSFTGWSGSITGTTNPVNITMNQDKSLSAEFTLLNRSLMVIANTGTGSGQVKVDDTVRTLPYQRYYPHGTIVKLEAVADAATSSFTGWNGALTGTTNPATITMDADKSVGAEFTLLQRTLSITKLGTGSGQVKVNGTTYDLPYEGSFAHNTVVNLEAVPDAATSSFVSWGGDLTGSVTPTTITMNGNKSVTASFKPLNRQLMVLNNTGTGSGEIKVNDTLRVLPYEQYYPHGTIVKLEAVPNAATSSFTGWSGAASGTLNPINITMDGDKSLSAEFTLLNRQLMVLENTGTGTGEVKVNDTVRTLPYEHYYSHGTVVKLEAVANASTSSFTGWSGALTGTTNPANITMDGDKSVSAAFTLLQRTLSITKTGTGAGQVKVNGTLYTLPYEGSFAHNTVVNLEAVADGSTSSFTGWGGGLSGTTNPTTITMSSNQTVTADFTLLKRSLMVLQNTGTGTGQVKVNDTLRTLPYSASYPHGTIVKLEAVADGATSSFTGWSGSITGTTNPVNITMDQDRTVSASFTLISRKLMVIENTGTGSGQVKVDDTVRTLPYQHYYPHGTIVKLEAVADAASSSFTGWSGALTGTTNPANITMDGDKSVGAEFTLIQRTLKITKTGTGSGQVKVNGTLYTLPYEGSFAHNTTVNLEAVADASTSSFTAWGGALSGTTNPTSIQMNGDQDVTISFTLLNRSLMVLRSIGTGSGEVKVNDTVRTLPYAAAFPHGTIVKLEAVPNASTSSFTGWGGDLTGTVNPQNLTMDGNKTLYAEFNLLNRSLMVIANTGTGSGEVKVDDTVRTLPYQQYYPHGTLVKVEAVPDASTSSFTGWSGALTGTTNPATITMDADKSVGAEFTLLQRTLSITKLGTGSGQVKVNGTLYDLPYSGDFPHNSVVNLEAVPDAATSSFVSWGGDLTGSVTPTTITMNGNKNVTAAFTLLGRQLMVLENTGTGTGQVKVNDTLRTLPYSASYPHGTIVKLEAVADGATSSFTGWGGDISGTTNPVNITMNSNITVSAAFTLLKRSLMVLQNTGTGTGQVKVNDTLRTLPYSASYPHGTVVKLEAAADGATSSFTGWKGDLTGTTNPVSITMNSDMSLNAEFTLLKRSLMVLESTGTGAGTIKVNDTLRTLPYSASYPHGTVVKLEAVPDAQSIFTAWSGIAPTAVTANPVNITMDQDKRISAEFTLNQFTLKLNSAGQGCGSIMVNGVTVPLPFEKVYISGTDVIIKAIPCEGSFFDAWSGSLTTKDNPLKIKVNSNMTLTAAFNIIQYKLTIIKKGTGSGQVEVSGDPKTLPYEGLFNYNELLTLRAVPCEGSVFIAWGGDLAGTCSNTASIKMISDRNVTVEFNSVPCAPVLLSPVGQCGLVTINPLLKWQASQNATEYNVQVATDICFKSVVADEKVTCTNKQMGPLNYNTCYYWRVRAGNCAGFGKFSEAAVFKTEKQPVKAPCNLIAKAEYGKVRLIWSDSSDNESGFNVFRKEGDIKSTGTYEFMGKVDKNKTVFVDSTIRVNVTYTYKVSAFTADSVVSFSSEFSITNTILAVDENSLIPSDYKLFQNYPNPFNPSTVIRYYLKSDCHVKLTVFNTLGKEVSVLVNEFRESGMNTVTFNARDISAGVYLYRIETLEEESGKRYMDVKKLVLMK